MLNTVGQVTIYIKPRDHAKLKENAALEGKSLSEFLVSRGLSEEVTLSNLFKRRENKK
jgi:predicted HicB family RNase H-like nuclease